jgi:predicted ArsR family transcriptional regulator
LRSPDAFTLRRSQILLASNRGENAYQIAHQLGCNPQAARRPIHDFNQKGLPEALRPFDCLHYEHLSMHENAA